MPRNLFFYGTLRDRETRDFVLGPYRDEVQASPAQLNNHAVMAVKGEDYPIIVKSPGTVAHGILVEGLSDAAIARLNFFEDEFDYALETVEVQADHGPVLADVFYAHGDHFKTDGPWDYTAWGAQFQIAFAECARELMDHYGVLADEVVDRVWPGIRFRAYARARARAETPVVGLRSGKTRGDVDVEALQRPYIDYYAIEVLRLKHRKFDDSYTDMMERAVMVSGDAVAVLPYDPVRDQILLIEQFRPAPYARGDKSPWMLEPIAGRVDSIENSEQTARREALEEAGLTLGALDATPSFYSSPGAITEKMTCYVGQADLGAAGGVHGLDGEGEDIRSIIISYDQARAALASGEIENGPLIVLLQHLFLNRERIRAAWSA